MTKTNCLMWAVRQYMRHGGYIAIRRSNWGPFPHFLWLPAEGAQFQHYVPLKPKRRWIPPWRFKGCVRTGDKKVATLNAAQLAQARQRIARLVDVDFNKLIINAALQAIEDEFEAHKPAFNAAINTATSPKVLTVAQKKAAFALWAILKASIEGA